MEVIGLTSCDLGVVAAWGAVSGEYVYVLQREKIRLVNIIAYEEHDSSHDDQSEDDSRSGDDAEPEEGSACG